MRHIDYGLGAFWKSAFAARADDEAFDLTAVYQDLRAHGVDLHASVMVGDRWRWRDIEAGEQAGCATVFLDRGYAERKPLKPDAAYLHSSCLEVPTPTLN